VIALGIVKVAILIAKLQKFLHKWYK